MARAVRSSRLQPPAVPAGSALEGRLGPIFEHALDAIILVDKEGRYLSANPAACSMLGYSLDEFRSMRVGDLDEPARRQSGIATWSDLLKRVPIPRRIRVCRKDGTVLDVEVRLVASILPGLHAAFFRDVTTQIRAVKALQRQAQIVEHIQQPILTTDLEGNILSWNPAAEREIGYSASEVLGRHLSFLYSSKDLPVLSASLKEPLRAGGQREFEVRALRKSGGEFFGHLKVSVIRDDAGRPVGLIRSLVDETARIKAEKELQQSRDQLRTLWARVRRNQEEQLRLLSRELHDQVGQPLIGLKMDVHWLQQRIGADGAGRDLSDKLEEMLREIVRAIRLVRRLSASLRPTVLDRLGLVSAIRERCREFERRSGIRCRVDAAMETLDLGSAAATNLFRIFEQALANVAEHAHANSVSVALARSDGRLTISISDNGTGIPAAAITSARSLGLMSMRERAAQLSGVLTITRGSPSGTVVTVTIPLP